MKSIFIIVLSTIVSCGIYAQKKERIKGSKIVTQSNFTLEDFSEIELSDNFEVQLVKSDTPSLDIEADDNLHDIISFAVVGSSLKISTLKDVSSSKMFLLKINYTNNLNSITAKNEVELNATNELQLDSLTINLFDKAEATINAKSNFFKLVANDKTEATINVKTEEFTLEASKNGEIEALVTSINGTIDLYESAKVTIEGSTDELKLRLDNSSKLNAEKYSSKNTAITIESYAKARLYASNNITITASGKTEIELYGEPKVELTTFTNSTTLYKKE